MDKILSKDTIKNVFSALGAKTSDSNYGVALLDKTSGEPKGFMGMSDLASVLGALTFIIDGSHPDTSGDFNNYTTTGIFTINTFSSPMENSPQSGGLIGLLFVFGFNGRSNSIAMQVIITIRSNHMYFREGRTDNGWGVWKSIEMS